MRHPNVDSVLPWSLTPSVSKITFQLPVCLHVCLYSPQTPPEFQAETTTLLWFKTTWYSWTTLHSSSFPPSTTDEKKSTSTEPKFVIFKDPPEGNAKFLVVEIQLPGIISAKSLLLDVNEDTLLLTTRSDLYHLHIKYLPFDVIPEETLAQFNKQNQCLTVTMTVNDMT